MSFNARSLATAALLVLALAAIPLSAQEAEPEMGADQAAMMEAWQKAMSPGEPHAHLAKAAGTWAMTIKSWMGGPDAEPTVSEGTSENTMILGGRVLEQSVTSSMMGMPYEGIAMSGYDNTTGKYWSSWVDSMSTGTYVGHGSRDEASGAITLYGEYEDPMGVGTVKVRSVMHEEGDDKSVFEWFETRDGRETMTMEITYTRQAE